MYIWNAEMTKVTVRCLLLDWNHWMSVHAMNVYFYLWLLKILWPENTSLHISRHLEFIIEEGHRVNWVSGSLGHKTCATLERKCRSSQIVCYSSDEADGRLTCCCGSTTWRSVWERRAVAAPAETSDPRRRTASRPPCPGTPELFLTSAHAQTVTSCYSGLLLDLWLTGPPMR